jgi:hypothetical protein
MRSESRCAGGMGGEGAFQKQHELKFTEEEHDDAKYDEHERNG